MDHPSTRDVLREWGWALRLGVELVSGLVVGAGIGWFLAWGTGPFLLVVFLLLGAAAGMMQCLAGGGTPHHPDGRGATGGGSGRGRPASGAECGATDGRTGCRRATMRKTRRRTHPIASFGTSRAAPIVGGSMLPFTNSALWMTIAVAVVRSSWCRHAAPRALVPGGWQSLAEMFYEFVSNMLTEQVGSAGKPFFPFVFTLFMFILFGNLLGMVPYSFTFTSHIIVTFALAFVVFLA